MTCEHGRRRQILDAAERLLRQYGPSKTTIADIAREAAVGVGTVYLEFASKDAIVEALSTSRHARVLGAMHDAAEAPTATWSERFCAVLDARVRAFAAMADEGAHAPDLVHCNASAVQSAHERYLTDERALIAGLLERANAAGEFAVTDASATAEVLLLAYASFSPPWLFRRPKEDVARQLASLHALVLRGLVARR